MFYITNARIGGYYKREADPDKSGFRVKHEDADTFETAEAAQAVIDGDKLLFSAPVFFAPEQVAEIEAKKIADVEVHEERTQLAADHFAEQQAEGTARDLAS